MTSKKEGTSYWWSSYSNYLIGDGYRYRCKGYWPDSSDRCKTENKRQPIIDTFASYSERHKVFNSRKILEGKNLSITSVTARRNYGWVNWEQREINMIFEMYRKTMERSYARLMTLPIVNLHLLSVMCLQPEFN